MPGPHFDSLAQLARLDTIDQELLALRARLTAQPAELGRRRDDVDAAAARVDELAAELAEAESQQRLQEGELSDVERKEKQGKLRLESLFVPEQVEATRRSIQTLADRRDELEFSILELMDANEIRRKELASARATVAGAREALGADQAAWDAEEPSVRARIDELDGQRGGLVPDIAADAIKAYNIGFQSPANRKKRGGTVTEGLMCIECRTEVPARWASEAERGEGIHRCPGCKRVILGPAPRPEADEVDA